MIAMPDAGCQMPDARCRMPDTRCRMPDARRQMPDARCRIPDAGYQMPDAGCRIEGNYLIAQDFVSEILQHLHLTFGFFSPPAEYHHHQHGYNDRASYYKQGSGC